MLFSRYFYRLMLAHGISPRTRATVNPKAMAKAIVSMCERIVLWRGVLARSAGCPALTDV
jgi:hypothetical protein